MPSIQFATNVIQNYHANICLCLLRLQELLKGAAISTINISNNKPHPYSLNKVQRQSLGTYCGANSFSPCGVQAGLTLGLRQPCLLSVPTAAAANMRYHVLWERVGIKERMNANSSLHGKPIYTHCPPRCGQ